MLKLIIVDDEKMIRQGLKECLVWADLGIEFAGEARNGKEALELVKMVRPDIVLSDIRMPLIDGIEMGQQIKKQYPELKIIYISGYSDLEYLKAAFKLESIDYILKPVDIEELQQAIIKTVHSFQIEKKKESYRQELERKLLESMPYLREKFMKLLVSGELQDEKQVRIRLEFLDIQLPFDSLYSIFVIQVDDYAFNHGGMPFFDRQLLSFSILNIVQELISNVTQGISFEWSEDIYVCIIKLPDDETEIEECIDNLSHSMQTSLNKYLSVSNTLGIGLWVTGLNNIGVSYKHAVSALNQKFLLGKNRVIYLDKLNDGKNEISTQGTNYPQKLHSAICAGDVRTAAGIIIDAFYKQSQLVPGNVKSSRDLSLQLAASIADAAKIICSSKSSLVDLYDITVELLKKETLDDICQYLVDKVSQICEEALEDKSKTASKVVSEIQNIIRSRYAENLSIHSLAREVFLTPTYICMLFKQETGHTINDFLTKVRLEKAKELIRKGDYKLYEISDMTGYGDHKYFSKLFKKHTGLNPSEFR